MLLRPDPTASSSSSSTSTSATKCSNCGLEERKLLHHVRHRANFRRLCTSCVLRLHPQSFCPTCFNVYHPSPIPSGRNDAVTCFKCYSSSHALCVGPSVPNPYICPLCVSPNSPIFVLKTVKDLNREELKGLNGKEVNGEYRVFDNKAAKILLAAAKIASVSMSKAAAAARMEAEKRAREAAITRKRAREALEHVANLVAKEKLKKTETAMLATSSAEVSRSIGGAGGGASVPGVPERRDNPNVSSSDINGKGGNMNSSVMGMEMVGQERLLRVGNMSRVDGSNEVLAALNAVELRGEEKMAEFKVENSMVGTLLNDVVAMDVEENGGVEVNPTSVDGKGVADDHGGRNEIARSGNLNHLENNGGQSEKVSNGQVLVPYMEDQVEHSENSQPGKLNKNGSEQ